MSRIIIPPIIEQWVENLNNKNTNSFSRENYAANLERTRDFINIALKKFENEKLLKVKQNRK